MLMFTYNNSVHTTTKEKPATLLFGYEPLSLLGLLQQDAPNVLEEEHTALMQERRLWVEEAIRIAQENKLELITPTISP